MTTASQIRTAVAESSTQSRTVDLKVPDVADAIATLLVEHGLADYRSRCRRCRDLRRDSVEVHEVTEAWGTDDDGSEWRLALRATA